jgi:murein DD-endopeptidase MepM/ murein hydrolase activator NlpD
VTLGLGLAALAQTADAGGPSVSLHPVEPRPGDVVWLRVAAVPAGLTGEWAGRPLRFVAAPDGAYALVGIDLEAPSGRIGWRLTRSDPGTGRVSIREGHVTVRPRAFPTQTLTLPRHQVDLDEPTMERVRAEGIEIRTVLETVTREPRWKGRFRVPVEGGQPTGGFGLRRIINGQPRSPHAGYDWAAPPGTPVVAANAGRVALVAEHFFAGRLVVLDHGLGLHTLYFHLDGADVAPGEHVTGGQRLGRVGATGRVTGPHLHFGVVLQGARVDPIALLGLPLPD